MSSSIDSRLRRVGPALAALVIVILACAGVAGCAMQDTDIPWNAPQPWEGSPTIPGMPR